MDEEIARLQGLARLVFTAAAVALVLLVVDLQVKNEVVREAEALRAELLRARLQNRKAVTTHARGTNVADRDHDGDRGMSGVDVNPTAQ